MIAEGSRKALYYALSFNRADSRSLGSVAEFYHVVFLETIFEFE